MNGVDAEEIAGAVADELYGLPPEEFTAARDEAVRATTDPEAKAAVKALRRPTAAAYAVNRLVRDNPRGIDELLAIGADLRAAMTGHGGDVRELGDRRRTLIADLVDPELTPAVGAEVAATLEAATADPALGEAVRSGRLVKPLRYAGFGELPDLADAVAVNVGAATRVPKEPAPDLTELRQRVLDLAGIADDAQRRYDAAVRTAVEARAALDRAEEERAEAHAKARAAHAEAEKVRRELGKAERT